MAPEHIPFRGMSGYSETPSNWIGVATRSRHWWDCDGLRPDAPQDDEAQAPDNERLLVRGTVVLETHLAPDARPQTLIGIRRDHPWPTRFALTAIPGGGLAVISEQNGEMFHGALYMEAPERFGLVRLTYAWDAPARWARLSLEMPETGHVSVVHIDGPKPLRLADLRAMIACPPRREMSADTVYAAVSREIEPVGPMPALSSDVPVATPHGYQRAGDLKRGDLVLTREGVAMPVLKHISRTVPAFGHFKPVHLRAPYFGLKQDIEVAPHQKLMLGGSDVEYLFGRERVLVAAHNLVNNISALPSEPRLLVTYHHVLLPGHEVIRVAGASLESLYIGRLRRKPERLAASVLASVSRNHLPEHAHSAYPILKSYDAIALVQEMAA